MNTTALRAYINRKRTRIYLIIEILLIYSTIIYTVTNFLYF